MGLLIPVEEKDLEQYKADMQEAFQKGFENEYGETKKMVLPTKDIDHSLRGKDSIAYKAIVNNQIVGGAIVSINQESQHNHLDFLFVKYGTQSKGIGKIIWNEIEQLHSETKVWETATPYFEKRNIHFYVNVCGFHIVEFFNDRHKSKDLPDDFIGDGNEGMFIFKKEMTQ